MDDMNPASIVLGPFLLGLVVSLALYGIEVAQAIFYTRKRGFNGRPWIKALVSFLLALETLHIAIMAAYIYGTLIISRGNVTAVVSNFWGPSLFPLEIITTGFTAFMAQVYFAWTVHMVIRKKWLTCVIIIVATTGLAASLWAGIAIITIPVFADWQRISPAMCLWLASALVADCISSGSLVYYLRQRSTRISAPSHLVNRFISITLASGMVTSCTSLACLLAFALNGPHLAFEAPFGKLYLNSVLSMLNSGSYEDPHTETEEDSTTGHHQLTSIQLDCSNSSQFQLEGT